MSIIVSSTLFKFVIPNRTALHNVKSQRLKLEVIQSQILAEHLKIIVKISSNIFNYSTDIMGFTQVEIALFTK